jgi:hypothetical protein
MNTSMRVLQFSSHVSIILLALAFSACVDLPDSPTTYASVHEIVNKITVSPDAVLMAVGDSIPMTVTAQNVLGEALPMDSTPVVWSSADTMRVAVDGKGMLHALHADSGNDLAYVIASWTHSGVTRYDTVAVSVSQTRQPIAGIRIALTDSARVAINTGVWMSVVAVDATGTTIGMPHIPLVVSNAMPSSSAIIFYLGQLGALIGGGTNEVLNQSAIGDFWLYARGTVYGVPMQDSLKLTGLYPAARTIPFVQDSASLTITSVYSNQEVFVQPCGTISFANQTTTPLDVVFDDPSHATGCAAGDPTGDIIGLAAGVTLSRKFRDPGTITWKVRNAATGTDISRLTGRVTMKEPNQ